MQIFDFEQRSPEWYEARRGILTSSEFHFVLMQGKKAGEPSVTREKLLRKKAAERITGTVAESYGGGHLQRGREYEPVALEVYQELTGNTVKECGFIRSGDFGASTDGLIENGVVEIKSKIGELQIEALLADEMPKEYKAQVQGELLISGAEYADYFSHCPGLPPFLKRTERDEEYISMLKEKLEEAEEDIKRIVKEIMERF